MDIQKYKKMLEIERDEVIAIMKDSGGYTDPDNPHDWEAVQINPESSSDESDVAESIEDLETNAGIVNNLEVRLHEINEALQRIEQGTYGFDVSTGEPISTERLDVNPAATTAL